LKLTTDHLRIRPLPTEEDVASHTLAPSGNLSGNLFILLLLFILTDIADETVEVGINTGMMLTRRRKRSTHCWRQRRSASAWNARRRRRLKIRRGEGRRVRHSGHFVDNLCTTPPPYFVKSKK